MDSRTDAASEVRELTLRGFVLGALITVVFTAANIYLGLKVGLTFATSIPAAVISIAVLRAFRDATILENNIVQTIASAAGTLSAIIFVLPGLVILGWWQDFPYWTCVAVIGLGGILGVMLSVPLRRALVTGSDLPYPEGVAAAEVLKVGHAPEGGADDNRRGLRALVSGSLASAGFAALAGTGLIAAEASKAFRLGSGATAISPSFSLALIGVGHLVGLSVGFAMLAGLLISWGVLVPHYTAQAGVTEPLSAAVSATFKTDVRLIGAGVIGVAAVWTLIKILGPIAAGFRSALAAAKARRGGDGAVDVTERDIPIAIVAGVVALSLAPIAFLLLDFAGAGPIAEHKWPIVIGSVVYVVLTGGVIAAVCGYMAGLIGSSNSPISGVGILAVLGAALLLAGAYGEGGDPARLEALTAYALMVTAVVFGVATISNDNLQDLKAGQIVGATPWRQQVALIGGVIFGALVIPPVLNLLNATFGFSGAPGAGPEALAAPQATLISALAKGVLGGDLDWSRLGLGAAIGVAVVALDETLARTGGKLRLPPLGVGMGMYLPMSVTLMVPVGALIGWLYDRSVASSRDPEAARRLGVLLATGLIVGESLFGVAIAGLVAGTGSESPLALVDGPELAPLFGLVAFAAVVAGLYVTARRSAAR